MTPEQKRLDKYYLRKFGWTLAEVDAMFAEQGNVCAACKRPPGERRMSVDHDHALDRVKIKLVSQIHARTKIKFWIAFAQFNGRDFTSAGSIRAKAKETVRRMLRRLSVRGGLCFLCNSGLQKFEDSKAPLPPAERLERLAQYLRRFNSGVSHEASPNSNSGDDSVSQSHIDNSSGSKSQ